MRNSQGTLSLRHENITPKIFASSAFRIAPLPTEVAEEARHLAESGAEDHAVIKVDSRQVILAGIVCVGRNLASASFYFPTLRFLPGHPYSETGPIFVHAEPVRTLRRDWRISGRFSQMAAYSALTMQITT